MLSGEQSGAECFPQLLIKVSEPRQNNKKPLQKHTRKSQRAETIRGLRHTHPLKTLTREQKQVKGELLDLLVSRPSRLLTLRTGPVPASSERSWELRPWGLRNLTCVLRTVRPGDGTVPECSVSLGRQGVWEWQGQAGWLRAWGLF